MSENYSNEFTVCFDKINTILKDLSEPSLSLNVDEVCDGCKKLVEEFKCIICHTIPTRL